MFILTGIHKPQNHEKHIKIRRGKSKDDKNEQKKDWISYESGVF